jgi:hypothetical protein
MDKAAATTGTKSSQEDDNDNNTLAIHATAAFSVVGRVGETHNVHKNSKKKNKKKKMGIFLDINDVYTRHMIQAAFASHPMATNRKDQFRLVLGPGQGLEAVPCPKDCDFQWSEYERIDWDQVLSQPQEQQPLESMTGSNGQRQRQRQQRLGASSYCIRKGLCRKAQMAHYVHRYICKHPERRTILETAIPQTIIIDTWPVWEDNHTNNNNHHHHHHHRHGEGLADIIVTSTTSSTGGSMNRRHRLDQCLVPVKTAMDEAMQRYEQEQGDNTTCNDASTDEESSASEFPVWILKPSTVNKGAGIQIVHCYEQVVDLCWEEPDIREW